MDELRGKKVIGSLRRKWNLQNVIAYLILSFAITLFVSAFVIKLIYPHYFLVPVILIIVLAIVFLLLVKKISEQDVVKFLNQRFSDLEESCHLLLKPLGSLNSLERLQFSKVENRLNEKLETPAVLRKKIRSFSILLVIALLTTTTLYIIPYNFNQHSTSVGALESVATANKQETKLPQVEVVNLKITPPAYTGKGSREQDRFNVVAEQDAVLQWNITTTAAVKEVQLIFNDKTAVRLQPTDRRHIVWTGNKAVVSSGFYQVKIGSNFSQFYQVEMVKDQPPVIAIQSPKPNTVIEYGQPQKVVINVSLSDDYGIESTYINATTASGSGEAVKFKEQQISFTNFSAGRRQYQLQKQVDLAGLGMQPGDELYFYINAKDNYHQQKRSDVYVVRMEDTTQLMSMEGLESGVDIKPEFFRSERQIIIETEQLLKDRDTINVEIFNKKSSDLGIDQKLLRLRYGKFLGEESESEIGEDHRNPSSNHNDAGDIGNADKILDQYSHKHDNAEDPTFFDANTKKQLLATLSEMWKAELQLRTLKPKEALPFEYKALRLLKDLQQQTRAYVGKTSTKTTPLKPEIRLTGDLSKVVQPVVEENFQQKTDPITTLRKALGILEQVRNKEALQKPSLQILEQASMQLSTKAASEPAAYLASLEALRRILKMNFRPKDIDLAGSAFLQMIRSVSNVPQQSKTSPDMKLSHRYFLNLNRKND
jgi:hypothetical protein